MCIRVYPLQEKELAVISTIGANDTAEQNNHFSLVQFKIGDRFEFERFMFRVNGQSPESEQIMESGPPIFRSQSSYRMYLGNGQFNQEVDARRRDPHKMDPKRHMERENQYL